MPPTRTNLLAAVTALACSACAPSPSASLADRPLRVAIDVWPGYFPLLLADDLGYLAESGVRVDVVTPRNTDRMLADFAARDYDAVCVSLGDVIVVTRAVPDLRVVLVSDESAGADQILARDPVQRRADLVGKRIGTNLRGCGELFVRRLLAAHGVSVDEVELVDTEAARVPDLLTQGNVDVAHTWDPYASEARRRGMQVAYTSRETPGLIRNGLVFRGDTLRARPGEVRALVQAWFRAAAWWRDHAQEGDRRIEKRLKLLPGEARPNGVRLLDAAENRELLAAADGGVPPLAGTLQQFVDFAIARGLLLQRPDPSDLVHEGALP